MSEMCSVPGARYEVKKLEVGLSVARLSGERAQVGHRLETNLSLYSE